jgi:hypothetical protein
VFTIKKTAVKEKKDDVGSEISADMIVVAVISLIAFVLLFGVAVSSTTKSKDNPVSSNGYTLKNIISDNAIDDKEMAVLSTMSCEDIKKLINTDREVCIYFRDDDGNIISLGDKFGFGCPGINVDGVDVCKTQAGLP